MTISEKVERSAQLLDTYFPAWFRKVDTKNLVMADVSQCVAGQLGRAYGVPGGAWGASYVDFVTYLVNERMGSKVRAELGLDGERYGDDSDKLAFNVQGGAAWKREINARLAVAA